MAPERRPPSRIVRATTPRVVLITRTPTAEHSTFFFKTTPPPPRPQAISAFITALLRTTRRVVRAEVFTSAWLQAQERTWRPGPSIRRQSFRAIAQGTRAAASLSRDLPSRQVLLRPA